MAVNNEYVPMDGFLAFIKELKSFYKKQRMLIAGGVILFTLLGVTLHFIYKPRYEGKLTFVLQSEDEMGSMSGLASQFGLSLGGSTGTFSGDNIYQLLNSRLLIQNALFTPIQSPSGEDCLFNEYLKVNKINKKWATDEDLNIRNLSFKAGQTEFTRQQDSVIGLVYTRIAEDDLASFKLDKKLSIGCLNVVSKSEFFSTHFPILLMNVTSDYYIRTKTKVARKNYMVLKAQIDSVHREYNRAVLENASLVDENSKLIRQKSAVQQITKQTEVQLLAAAYIEMTKNLEVMKMTINKKTPLVEIIDRPIMPLDVSDISLVKGTVLGAFFGCFVMFLSLLFCFIGINRKRLI